MAYKVILDTSAAIELLKRNDRKVIEQIEKEKPEEVLISGVTRFELEVGSGNEERIGDIPCVSLGCEAFALAGRIFSSLGSKGRTPSIKDCFIAACAIVEEGTLITYDRDFEVFKEYGLDARILKKG
jgi:predicted nucleic acid-binding protein